MNALIELIRTHGTKALGFIGITIGVLAVADPALVGGPTAIKYYLLFQSLLTVWRGFFNTGAIADAVVTKATSDPAVAQKVSDMVSKSSGFARLSLLVIVTLLSVGTVAVSTLEGCVGTRAAYKEASGVDETAYVVAEQYSALVKEAADLKENASTPPDLVSAMQSADRVANPLVHKLREARDIYLAAKTATNQAALQKALDDASGLVADLSRTVARARATK